MSGTIEVAIVVSAEPSSSEFESDELAATSSCRRRSACSAIARAVRSASSSDSRSRSPCARRAAAATSASDVASISAMPVPVSCTGSPRPSATAASRRRAIAYSMRREAKRAASAASTVDKAMPPPKTSIERQNACSPTDRGMPRATVQPGDLMRASAVLTRSPSTVEVWPNPSSRPFRVDISCCSESPGGVPRSFVVIARAGDPDVVGVEDRDGPHRRHALAVDDGDDRLRLDDRAQHIAQRAVAHHRNAHRDAAVAERPGGERADRRRAGAHGLGHALQLGQARRLRAGRQQRC